MIGGSAIGGSALAWVVPTPPDSHFYPETQPATQTDESLGGGYKTYAGFRTRLNSYIDTDGTDIDAGLLDDVILAAENRINRELRCRDMETPLALVARGGRAQIPADYLELLNVYTWSGGRRFNIERMSLEALQRRFFYGRHATNGPQSVLHAYGGPISMARDGDTFVFAPHLVDGATVDGTYYVKYSPLKDRPGSLLDPESASYQRLYANNCELYLYAALSDPEALIGRASRSQRYEALYQMTKQGIMTASQAERFSGSTLRKRAR